MPEEMVATFVWALAERVSAKRPRVSDLFMWFAFGRPNIGRKTQVWFTNCVNESKKGRPIGRPFSQLCIGNSYFIPFLGNQAAKDFPALAYDS